MTTAQRLQTVKANVSEVFHSGQLDVIKNSDSLSGSKSGKSVVLSDISEVSHTLDVTVSGDTVTDFTGITLTRCGKNLFDEKAITTCKNPRGVSAAYGEVTNEYLKAKAGAYSTTTAWEGFSFYLKSGVNYTISTDIYYGSSDNNSYSVYVGVVRNDFTYNVHKSATLSAYDIWERKSITFSVTQDAYYNIQLQPVGNKTRYNNLDCRFKNIQLELSSTASPYQAYQVGTYTPSADGTVSGITNIYPVTTLFTDTDGAVINVNYYKDIDKASKVLSDMVLSDFGNGSTWARKAFDSSSGIFNDFSVLSLLDFSGKTNLYNAFASCYSGTAMPFPKTNLSKVTNLDYAFSYSNFSTVPDLDTSEVKTFHGACSGCPLTEFPNWDLSSATDLGDGCFQGANFRTVPAINTSKVTEWYNTFSNCQNLETIEGIDFSSAGDIRSSSTFDYCDHLKNITVNGIISGGINFQYSSKLTHESLMSIINALENYAESGTTGSLTLNSQLSTALTDDEIAIATAKGWTVQFI